MTTETPETSAPPPQPARYKLPVLAVVLESYCFALREAGALLKYASPLIAFIILMGLVASLLPKIRQIWSSSRRLWCLPLLLLSRFPSQLRCTGTF